MLPKFLQPEAWPTTYEVIPADRDAFHTFLTDPATGPKLDAMLVDNARVDAQLEADRDEFARAAAQDHAALDDDRDDDRGATCSANCGYCGGCS